MPRVASGRDWRSRGLVPITAHIVPIGSSAPGLLPPQQDLGVMKWKRAKRMESRPLPVVLRSRGTTPAERYLSRLCEQTFLSLWSYPGIYRDQGNTRGGDGKEVCDLLVLFGNDIVIFSDKDCSFPSSGDIRMDWSRWFRRAVLKSAMQAWGAERWIRQHPDRIFMDRSCKQRFPLSLPPARESRFHHIIVAHGVSEPCRKALGGSGTLMFATDVAGGMHYDPRIGRCDPFTVGWIDPSREPVHVLDDSALQNRTSISEHHYRFHRVLDRKRRTPQGVAGRWHPFICCWGGRTPGPLSHDP